MTMDIHIRGVTKTFGASPALHGVDLDIQSGELIGLLGPSGSGKTTLLRILAGLETPTGGDIRFGEQDMAGQSVQERRVGFVFQSYALFRHMSVAQNIGYGLRVRPRATRPSASEISRRVEELLGLVQLKGFESRFPGQLSGGQRQRVALARALAVEPRVLLLDEPFGALDAQVRKDLRRWLREIHDRTGHTTVFVTHDQDEALEMSDRVAVLNRGALEQVATPDEIYDNPATPFIYGFIGDANRIDVSLRNGQVGLGDTVLARAPASAEGKAELFFRPEHAALDEAPGATRGTLVALRRTGAKRRGEIKLDGAANTIEIDLPATTTLTLGDRVGVRLDRFSVFSEGRRVSALALATRAA